MKKIIHYIPSILSILVIVFGTLGFLFAPNDPEHVDVSSHLISHCKEYPLGTDALGRCVLSRVLYGGFTTLGIVLLGSIIVIFIGTFIGIFLGTNKEGKNIVFESILNAVTAIPPIAYLIIFISAWGNSVFTMIVALTVSLVLRMIKIIKTKTEIEYKKAYVLCAISSGASTFRVLFVHIMPNVVRDALHFVCLSAGEMILSISGFSFIGLSLGDSVIDWGGMVSEGRNYISTNPGLMFYPMIFIFICVFAFNILARELEKGGHIYA
ncbi:MAG: ABC transporter permease [Clostridium butyricum]|nr:ABC transporter permease [Clostridium butyricum]